MCDPCPKADVENGAATLALLTALNIDSPVPVGLKMYWGCMALERFDGRCGPYEPAL
jgi:hypothetical protein